MTRCELRPHSFFWICVLHVQSALKLMESCLFKQVQACHSQKEFFDQ